LGFFFCVKIYKNRGDTYMNKKECNEIKKLFTPANCAISRICGCYVDSEKNKKTELKKKPLNILPFSAMAFQEPLEKI